MEKKKMLGRGLELEKGNFTEILPTKLGIMVL